MGMLQTPKNRNVDREREDGQKAGNKTEVRQTSKLTISQTCPGGCIVDPRMRLAFHPREHPWTTELAQNGDHMPDIHV